MKGSVTGAQSPMTRSWRALKPGFIRFIHLEVTFPPEKVFRSWFEARYGQGFRSGSYGQLKDGLALPARIVEAFVVYCCEFDATAPRKRMHAAMRLYCAPFGIDDVARLEDVLDAVAPTTESCRSEERRVGKEC